MSNSKLALFSGNKRIVMMLPFKWYGPNKERMKLLFFELAKRNGIAIENRPRTGYFFSKGCRVSGKAKTQP
mgnify:CR=1 FL=1